MCSCCCVNYPRWHPTLALQGFEQVFKNALTTLPMGGGKASAGLGAAATAAAAAAAAAAAQQCCSCWHALLASWRLPG